MINSFNAIVGSESRILILGSMPGNESLRQHQYYAQKTNTFWKIMFELFDNPFSEDYELRKKLILDNKLALWDVLSTCEREGSLDSRIRNEVANDFESLFREYPHIDTIYFNGKKAYDSYKRWIGFDEDSRKNYVRLPSTSAAHAIKYIDKLSAWKVIIE
jgi:TDG/mug DNA glycosylase family protein